MSYLGNAKLISNTYENGKGVLTFDKNIGIISENFFAVGSPYEGYMEEVVDNLDTIYLPKSVKIIETGAFFDVPLQQITFPKKS
jgi:hypothetical protein